MKLENLRLRNLSARFPARSARAIQNRGARAVKLTLWRLFLWAVRAVTLTVDDWVQAQEIRLRQTAAMADFLREVDPAASAARESEKKSTGAGLGYGVQTPASVRITHRSHQFAAGVPGLGTAVKNGARHSRRAGAPRLRYQHGQFVREGAL